MTSCNSLKAIAINNLQIPTTFRLKCLINMEKLFLQDNPPKSYAYYAGDAKQPTDYTATVYSNNTHQ